MLPWRGRYYGRLLARCSFGGLLNGRGCARGRSASHTQPCTQSRARGRPSAPSAPSRPSAFPRPSSRAPSTAAARSNAAFCSCAGAALAQSTDVDREPCWRACCSAPSYAPRATGSVGYATTCGRISSRWMPATVTGFFMASRRKGSPSSWFRITSMKVVTPLLCASQASFKAAVNAACVLTVTPFKPQPSATFA